MSPRVAPLAVTSQHHELRTTEKETLDMSDQQALRTFTLVFTLVTALALTLVFVQPASAQTENVLYNFALGSGVGGGPYTGLITDSAGNLYGAARSDTYYGAAYELIPSSGGGWTLRILHE